MEANTEVHNLNHNYMIVVGFIDINLIVENMILNHLNSYLQKCSSKDQTEENEEETLLP